MQGKPQLDPWSAPSRPAYFFLPCLPPKPALSQTGTIRGFLYDKETGEPMLFTNVILKGTTTGAATDVNGYFSITRITPGSYTIMVTALGYDTLQQAITVTRDQILTEKLYLSKSAIQMREFEVKGEKQESQTQVRTGVTKLTPRQIERMPSVGGTADLAQYLQVVPGVIFTGDQGGQLYVRGGSPIMNKVMLDGMVLYNPFHSIGLFSVFDNDIIRNADIYTAGFNAEYGGRISSVMDITTRDGNKTTPERQGERQHLRGQGHVGRSAEKAGRARRRLLLLPVQHAPQLPGPDQQECSTITWTRRACPSAFTDIYGKVSASTGPTAARSTCSASTSAMR